MRSILIIVAITAILALLLWRSIVPTFDNLTLSVDNYVENASINAIELNKTSKPSRRKSITMPLSTSYLLWSKTPHSANWSIPENMCDEILISSKISTSTLVRGRKWTIPDAHSDKSMANLLSDCAKFRESVPFATESASAAEAQYPLAYVFVGARNAAQAIRLLRMIYQPQNAYCLTYDLKSSKDFQDAIISFAKCFKKEKNVFLTPSPEKIYYGNFSILHSVTVCLKVLQEKWKIIPWKYVQIVSWNDFPLRTNDEMVKIFKIFNGSQDSEMLPLHSPFMVQKRADGSPIPMSPSGLKIYKGSFATSMTKEFIDFLFTDPTAVRLFDWIKYLPAPEEPYWETIIYNLHLKAPGSFPGHCADVYEGRREVTGDDYGVRKPFASRYQVWSFLKGRDCRGKHVALSCVYGVEDVPTLIKRPELIAHKIYEEYEPLGAFCLERWFWNRVSGRKNYTYAFDSSFYEGFPSVRYHKMEDKDTFVC